jgi:hypothetical protein
MSTPKRPRDPNQLAKMVVDIASGTLKDALESASSPMAELGRARDVQEAGYLK